MKKLILILIVLPILMVSCKTIKESKTDTLPTIFYKRFTGSIDRYKVTMQLFRQDSVLTGSYFYNNRRIPLTLNGKITSNGSFELMEKDFASNNNSGTFTGSFIGTDSIHGEWTNTSNGKKLSYALKESYDNAAQISVALYQRDNCLKADSIRKTKVEIEDPMDTVCSSLQLKYLQVKVSLQLASDEINKNLLSLLGNFKSVDEYLNTFQKEMPESYSKEEVEYEVINNDNNLLSIAIHNLREEQGMPHPDHLTRYVNFNRLTGKELKADDIFVSGYNEKLIPVVAKNFSEQRSSDETFDAMALVTSDNFLIAGNGITFTYKGTYIGTNSIFVPYSQLTGILKDKSFLSSNLSKK